jgi:hypothetical protein
MEPLPASPTGCCDFRESRLCFMRLLYIFEVCLWSVLAISKAVIYQGCQSTSSSINLAEPTEKKFKALLE